MGLVGGDVGVSGGRYVAVVGRGVARREGDWDGVYHLDSSDGNHWEWGAYL